MALVHSMSEQDFFHLVQDIGPEDALPIIGLASNRQWEFLFDMQIWQRDRMDIAATADWIERLQRANPQRSMAWLVEKKTDMLEFFLFKNIEVKIREHDQDPGEFGQGYFSLDNVFYIRPHPLRFAPPAEGDDDPSSTDPALQFVETFVRSVADYDYVTYQRILLEASALIPAETEEDVYRQRCLRLAEKGFLPFDEAVALYRPLRPEHLLRQNHKRIPAESPLISMAPVPVFPDLNDDPESLFARTLAQIQSPAIAEHLQGEFAALCNQIVVADLKKIQSRDDLGPIVKKACGYLSIGLQSLQGKTDDVAAGVKRPLVNILTHYPLAGIFQVGFGQALALKWRAEKWVAQSWFAANGLPLTFWGEDWLGVLGGLLLKKPLYFDNYRSGEMYREFQTVQDLDQTSQCLDRIIAFDRMLSELSIDLRSYAAFRFLTYKNLLLTVWARHERGLAPDPGPLPMVEFKAFFESLWTGDKAARRIRSGRKTDFLRWLSDTCGRPLEWLSERYAEILDNLFKEIEDEFAPIRSENLDPRFIYLFLIEK
jgi:hypothetical protein